MFPQGTGWIPDRPDPRDYGPAHENLKPILAKTGLQQEIAEPPAELPPRIDLRASFPPVIAQGPLNTCTAATASALIGFFEKKTLGRDVSPSIMFLYKIERNLLGQSGDTGAFLRTAMQALRAFGVPPETAWPYAPELLDIEPAPFHYAYAANYKATHYFRLDDDGTTPEPLLERVKSSLAGSIPAMFGLALYTSLGTAGPGEIPLPGRFDAQTALHALVAVGYDDAKTIARFDPLTGAAQVSTGALCVRNSWGAEWGEGGYGWLPYDYVLSGLTSDWWCLLRADYLDIGDFRPRSAVRGGT
jgi:C1A family cysteine protease